MHGVLGEEGAVDGVGGVGGHGADHVGGVDVLDGGGEVLGVVLLWLWGVYLYRCVCVWVYIFIHLFGSLFICYLFCVFLPDLRLEVLSDLGLQKLPDGRQLLVPRRVLLRRLPQQLLPCLCMIFNRYI